MEINKLINLSYIKNVTSQDLEFFNITYRASMDFYYFGKFSITEFVFDDSKNPQTIAMAETIIEMLKNQNSNNIYYWR